MKTMRECVRRWAACWVLTGVVGGIGAQSPDATPPSGAPEPGPRLVVGDACKVSLAAAKAVAEQVKGLEGAERQAALEAGATAYEKVLAEHAEDPAGCAAGAFAAAELWRRHGSLPKAAALYLRAAEADPGRWSERGLSGAADMYRRQKDMEQALVQYRRVVALGLASNRSHDARVWIARCLDATGAAEEAEQAYRDALEAAATPRQVIDGGNWLAKALVSRGNLDGAQGVLEHVTKSVAAAEVARPEERARLDKAVETMSARRQLQRARDRAQGAAGDAQQVDGQKADPKGGG